MDINVHYTLLVRCVRSIYTAGISNPAPGDFSSNPAATHLSVIIK